MTDDRLSPTSGAISKFIEAQPAYVQVGLHAYRVALAKRQDWHRAVAAAIEAAVAHSRKEQSDAVGRET